MATAKRNPRSKTVEKPSKPPSKALNEDVPPERSDSGDKEYERELYWCIQQLEHSLKMLKPGSKQGEETAKLLRTLCNPKVSLVKKRQVMRSTFGDYRKKMKDQDKKFRNECKKIRMEKATESVTKGSKFYKRCYRTNTQNSEKIRSCVEVNQNLDFTGGSGQSFAFNFDIRSLSDSENTSKLNAATADMEKMEISSKNDNDGQEFSNCRTISKCESELKKSSIVNSSKISDKLNTCSGSENSFHWTLSNDPFKFDFPVKND